MVTRFPPRLLRQEHLDYLDELLTPEVVLQVSKAEVIGLIWRDFPELTCNEALAILNHWMDLHGLTSFRGVKHD